MSNIKKHTDVVSSMEEFTSNYEQGLYVAPWIVYVGNNENGYSVIYSNDEKKNPNSSNLDVIDSINKRLQVLEEEKVYCYEEEYDKLLLNGIAWVTDIDGTRHEVEYDRTKLYCIYEDDGSEEPEIPEEPSEPETPEEPEVPEEPVEPDEPNQGESEENGDEELENNESTEE